MKSIPKSFLKDPSKLKKYIREICRREGIDEEQLFNSFRKQHGLDLEPIMDSIKVHRYPRKYSSAAFRELLVYVSERVQERDRLHKQTAKIYGSRISLERHSGDLYSLSIHRRRILRAFLSLPAKQGHKVPSRKDVAADLGLPLREVREEPYIDRDHWRNVEAGGSMHSDPVFHTQRKGGTATGSSLHTAPANGQDGAFILKLLLRTDSGGSDPPARDNNAMPQPPPPTRADRADNCRASRGAADQYRHWLDGRPNGAGEGVAVPIPWPPPRFTLNHWTPLEIFTRFQHQMFSEVVQMTGL